MCSKEDRGAHHSPKIPFFNFFNFRFFLHFEQNLSTLAHSKRGLQGLEIKICYFLQFCVELPQFGQLNN